MLERLAIKLLCAGVLVLIFVAVLSLGGCGTIYGFGTDLRGASKGLSHSTEEMVKNDERN